MENETFSEKVEAYFSELGRWKIWRSIGLGQILSMLLSAKCIFTTLLQSATWQFPTTAQLVIPYLTLFILFMPTIICNGINKLSKKWWIVLLACVLDVEANWLLVLSQRFTSVLS
ncbi:unnamed protein product [Leptosia nina]|uniref:Uncharacterized protein n=1 Tax=Leptosia nina TaxID=320188 RepID=A0AAV1K0T7_9NEOP